MSIPVTLPDLPAALARYRFAYLLTSNGAEGAPHAVAVTPVWADGALRVEGLGRRTQANLQARPAVALVWPPADAADYSLIVDGQAALAGEVLLVTPTRAVLHRPAPAGASASVPGAAAGACGADCVAVPLPPG